MNNYACGRDARPPGMAGVQVMQEPITCRESGSSPARDSWFLGEYPG